MKSQSGHSLGEEKQGQKMNFSINSRVDQNEMVPFSRMVDVQHVSIEGIEKTSAVKTKKKKHKASILPKNLI